MTTLTVNDIIVAPGCAETDPCQHRVKVSKLGIDSRMDGREIYLLFVNNNLPVPSHFQDYDDSEEYEGYDG